MHTLVSENDALLYLKVTTEIIKDVLFYLKVSVQLTTEIIEV